MGLKLITPEIKSQMLYGLSLPIISIYYFYFKMSVILPGVKLTYLV